jgi:6-pyruvoyltetrahydropterin/6-carboxytetrahydropterin synthase
MELKVQHFFDASHQLPDTEHLVTKACARMHGHTYKVIVTIEGNNINGGMVIDFKAVKDIIDLLDHQHVNDIFHMFDFNVEATAENIAKFIDTRLTVDLDLNVKEVAVCEGYKGEERASYAIYRP